MPRFAPDGGDGGEGSTAGLANQDLSNVQYGVQPGTEENAVEDSTAGDPQKEFEELIKGKYKDQYNARVQDTVTKRLKSSKEITEKYNQLAPTLSLLSQKYGVTEGDIEALSKAIEEDSTYYEDEALERGISVEQLKEIKRIERENSALRQQMEERQTQENADRLYNTWIQQEAETKKVYPNFSLQTELQNQQFVDLIRSNIDVKSAYEVCHLGEIIPRAMEFASQSVQSKLANNIRANGMRPAEGASSSNSGSMTKSNVASLSDQDVDEILRRVQRGERISFS